MKEKKNRDESVDIKLNGSAFGGLFQTIVVFECSAGHQTRCFSFFIGVNRPAFGGTVPHFHQMSRGPAKSADVPHFSKMVLLFSPLPIRPYSTCLPRNATK